MSNLKLENQVLTVANVAKIFGCSADEALVRLGLDAIAAPGVIDRNALYTKPEAMARMNWRDAAWKAAIRGGLKVRYAGGRCYTRGAWLIEFIEQSGKESYQ